MAEYSKLGRASGPRRALLRNLTTAFLWNGKITTTETKAKAIQSMAEKLITLGVREYNNTVTVKKVVTSNERDAKGERKKVKIEREFTNDAPSKLHARRQMMSYLYNVPMEKKDKESKGEYKKRTGDVANPLVEKIFREYAPKYDKRAKESGQGGGYSRIVKLGPRKGDGAEMVLLELV